MPHCATIAQKGVDTIEPIKKDTCLRCGGSMKSAGTPAITLQWRGDKMGPLLNSWNHFQAEFLYCENCGKIEMYRPLAEPLSIPERACSRCGKTYDATLGECPHCAFPNEEKIGYSNL